MAGIATGSSAPASRQILLRTMHSISGSTEFGAALWRQGFLYILETRLVPIVDLQLQHIRERTQRLQQSAVTTSTFSDQGVAEAQFEQIYEDQLRDAHLVHSFNRPISLDDGSLARAVLDGTERVTDALTMAELVRQIYPTSDRLAREHILGFVREAPLTWGYWAGWKWLYKQAEVDIDIELLAEAHRRLEHEPAWLIPEVSSPVPFINRYPSPSTIRYLRCRMRRYQEKLHSSNPDQWLALQRALHVHHSPSEVDSIVVTMPIAEANNILERPTDTDDDASLFWNETTSAESREAVLVTLRRMIEQDVSRARPMLDSLVARMNVESAPVPEPARLAVCRFLSTVFDEIEALEARTAIASAIWRSGETTLAGRMHEELMRSSLADLPMWVESLRYAAPPSLSSILADVQTRIRYTVWDPDDLRAVASLIMSLDSPDLHQRVVERIPDWFLTDDMDLIDLFAHPIPEIAAWSKQQAIEVGLPGRAILQLVESNRHHDLDLLVQVATKIPANDPDLTRCVTRLIGDSRSVVRQIGIDLLQLQRASLPSESTLHVLTESPHRTFWSLALSILEDTPDLVSRFPRFVESALRGRWATSRQRSMLIRTIEAVPQRHIETLLEIARLGWPIHQEWALRLLIDVEMAGINVPGFALIDRQGLDQ